MAAIIIPIPKIELNAIWKPVLRTIFPNQLIRSRGVSPTIEKIIRIIPKMLPDINQSGFAGGR